MTANAASDASVQLSDRELQVALRYVEGQSHKEIARSFKISPATVRTHVNSVYRKLEVNHRIELFHRLQQPQAAQPRTSRPSNPPAELALTDLPDQPAVAVLPFQNLSGDVEQDYFADGMVEDVITALSRFKVFAVVARKASFAYKGRAVDVRQVAKELGVRYVVEGSVRRAGERLRVSVQLLEAASGAHLWADRFDGDVRDVFDMQDRITERVAGIVWPQIEAAEIERSRRERPESLHSYDLYLQALPLFHAATPDSTAAAYGLLSKAIAIEPENGRYLAEAARALERVVVMGWPTLTEDDRANAIDLARRAVTHAPEDASVLATCGMVLIHTSRSCNPGLAMLQRAAAMNPNEHRVMLSVGIGHLYCGSLDEAGLYFRRALQLSPSKLSGYVVMTGMAHAEMASSRFEEALALAEESHAMNADYDATYWMLIAANAQHGRLDEARRWAKAYRAIAPAITVARVEAAQSAHCPARIAAIIEGLRLAGLDEA